MMASSAGSDAFAIIALLVISLFVLLLLRHFLPLRTTPAYLTVPIFLALALPISIILLVPIDLASTTTQRASRAIWLPTGALLVAWRLTYWLTFALTWAILPLLGEYVDSGYRAPKDKFLYSLKSNGRYYLIVFACAGAAGIYVFLVNGFKTGSLKSLVMALAYCYGLVMAIYLMGHGLVAVPRRLFRNARPANRLRRIQTQAPKTNEKLTDATSALEELEAQLAQLRRRKNAVSRDHEDWIEEISQTTTDPRVSTIQSPQLPAVITDRYLAEFARKLIRARHRRIRFEDEWDRLVQESVEVEAVIDAATSKRLEGKPNYIQIIPTARLVGGGILSIASVCIVWSELIKWIAPGLSIISLTIGKDKINVGGQVIASMWLLYMSMCTLASFSDVKIWGNRALVYRNTYGESAAWYSSQIARLTIPLAYNFLTFLPRSVREPTTFYDFLGRLIDLTPLGKWFDYFFPVFILFPVCAALFNLYGRVRRIFGADFIDDVEAGTSALGSGGWREGRDLIHRHLQSSARLGLSRRAERSTQRVQSPVPTGPASSRPELGRQTTGARQAQRLADATQAAEEEDENFFQGFAHRVKNTFDTIERPAWLEELGKKPKWMTGNAESSGRAESGGLGRWFGGRGDDGRIRL